MDFFKRQNIFTKNSATIISHRGYKYNENTLKAFKEAIKYCDGVEGDFHLSSDNEIICIHDENTKRTFQIDKIVKNSTLKELQECTDIPTLQEVINILNGKNYTLKSNLI